MSAALSAAEELEHLRLAVALSGVEVPAVVLPESHDAPLGELRLHYVDWGTQGCRPMLLLHGGALTARTWDVVCLALRAQYHCLALDQRGHGDSDWSPTRDYDPPAHLRDLEALTDRLGLEQFVLVGQSMGALNAFTYAAAHSRRLAALVIIDAGPELRLEGAQRIGDFVQATAELDSLDDFVARARAFNPLRDERLLRRSLLHNLRRLPNGKWARKNDTRQWGEVDIGEVAARLREHWRAVERVTCPTLVVRGALSDVMSDDAAARFAAALPRGRWASVPDAGHTVQGDNPAGLIAVMRDFLGGLGV